MRVGIRRLPLAVCLAVLAIALVPAAANAAFGIASFDGQTYQADQTTLFTQAGGHPVFGITTYAVNTTGGVPDGFPDTVKNIRIDAPPGLITNPEAVPQCADPTPATCAPTSIIGDIQITAYFPVPIDLDAGGPLPPLGPGLVPLPTIPVYNMEQSTGQVSDFAFGLGPGTLIPRIDIIGGVRDTGDYGTFFTISDAAAVPSLVSSKLRFYGNPGLINPAFTTASFLSLPTQCSQGGSTKLTIESQSGQTATATVDNPPATGCDSVPFSASLDVVPSLTKRDSPTGADIALDVPQSNDPSVLATSHVEDTAITLPDGLTLNPSAANGLEACTDAQFGKGTHDAIGCPAASQIGTVDISSPPLRDTLAGGVWLGAPVSGDQYRVFLQAKGAESGLDVRLVGSIKPDPNTGRITAVFADTPQVPFSTFAIHLDPAKQLLATPLACGTAATTSVITPYRGSPDATPGDSFTVDSNGSGGACDGTPFSPGFGAGTSSSQAAGDTAFTADVSRADGQQFLSSLRITQPKGLLGRIPAVPQCSSDQANAGTCSDSSRIGTATVQAGAGNPFQLSGPVYLTGAYKGSPFGLSIVIRALAGPYDLGTVVVRAGISIDPLTAAITVDSDTLPQILQGIPLRLRDVKVTVDKQGFLFNGTECGPQFASASIASTGGASATGSATVPVTGCESLAFKPTMTAVTGGRPTKASGASLFVTVKQPAGQVNLRQVSVQLPKGYAARGTTLQQACARETFNADPSKCPAGSRVGTANATTPTLPFQLPGTAYLVARNAALPTLEVLLSNNLVNIHLSSLIAYDKRYISTFQNIPDAPTTEFVLEQPQGKNSSLAWTTGDICSHKLTMPTTFTGWDGRKLSQTTRITAENCPVKILAVRGLRGGKARVTLRIPEAGKLTLSGKGIRKTTRTFRQAAKLATVTIQRSSSSVRSTRVTARFVPTGAKKAQTVSGPVPLTPSVSTAAVRFPRGAVTGPVFTG